MQKESKIVLAVALVAIIAITVVGSLALNGQKADIQQSFGNLNVSENAYSSGVSYTSSTVGTVAVQIIPKATSSRIFASICNLTTSTVFLYKQATSTGIVNFMGFPVYSSSTAASQNCATYNMLDPYLGAVWAISPVSSTVSIEYNQQ